MISIFVSFVDGSTQFLRVPVGMGFATIDVLKSCPEVISCEVI